MAAKFKFACALENVRKYRFKLIKSLITIDKMVNDHSTAYEHERTRVKWTAANA